MRIAAVDLISNTCFPLLAADKLGLFRAEGLQVTIDLLPMLRGTQALKRGAVDLMAAGSVYDVLTEFPRWQGAKVVMALSQGTPWLLVVHADIAAKRGDLHAIKGLRLTAAEGPDQALRQMTIGAGIEPGRDFEIVELPGARERDVSFGVFAARALEAKQIDGFWANAMGAELAVSSGAGKVLIDVRRGDDPATVRHFTFAAMATTDAYLDSNLEKVEAAVRAIAQAQQLLRANPALAKEIGERIFPADAAALIARTIERDVAFYDPVISTAAVEQMNAFAHSIGHLPGPVPYEEVVDVRLRRWWVAT